MKRVFIFLLMVVYGLSTSGMTITVSYCCDKYSDISISNISEQKCAASSCGIDASCCSIKQVETKATSDHAAATWVQALQSPLLLHDTSPSENAKLRYKLCADVLARGTPVADVGIPLFLKHCVFKV